MKENSSLLSQELAFQDTVEDSWGKEMEDLTLVMPRITENGSRHEAALMRPCEGELVESLSTDTSRRREQGLCDSRTL